MPQGLPWSPILATAVINHFLCRRHPEISFTLFADDGIMFAPRKELIERVLGDHFLKQVGIVFSTKTRPDGSPASGYLTGNEVNFLGSTINLETRMIHSPKGIISLDSKDELINKVI